MLFEFREVRRRAIRYRGENHAAKALTSLEMLCVPSRLELIKSGKENGSDITMRQVKEQRDTSTIIAATIWEKMSPSRRHHHNNQSCQ